ncbi:MAG: DUF255 domain-containing protein [Bacteroidia bacterium]|jgi:thioredoxin-related protein|nr:DUF255 domain-containing protein [Bacteroidia bacterium]
MRAFIITTLLAGIMSLGMAPVPNNPEAITWLTIEEAYALSQRDGKKILIDFYTDWCGWCKKLDADTYSKANVISYINEHYHAVKFDAEQRGDLTLNGRTYKFLAQGGRGVHEFAAVMLNGRPSYPSTTILAGNLQPITTVPGYHGPAEMLMILSFLGEDHYKRTSFEEYKKTYSSK